MGTKVESAKSRQFAYHMYKHASICVPYVHVGDCGIWILTLRCSFGSFGEGGLIFSGYLGHSMVGSVEVVCLSRGAERAFYVAT